VASAPFTRENGLRNRNPRHLLIWHERGPPKAIEHGLLRYRTNNVLVSDDSPVVEDLDFEDVVLNYPISKLADFGLASIKRQSDPVNPTSGI